MKCATVALVCLVGAAASASGAVDVRAVHASPDAPNVDVLVNGGLAFANLPYRSASAYASVPAGDYNIKVRPAGLAGPDVIDADLTLSDNTAYSVAAINTLSSITPLVLVDDNMLNPSAARVRFVHASPNAPAVDIALAGGDVLFSNVMFGTSGGYITVPGGSYNLDVRLAGTQTVVLSVPSLAVANNTVSTVWAMGLVGNQETPLQAVVTLDAVPAPGAMALLGLGGVVASRRRR